MKRISCRGIIFSENRLYVLKRRKKRKEEWVEYYSIPGGGLEEGETLEECVLRELKEELSVTCKILGYLGQVEEENSIQYFFHCEKVEGEYCLGGEEKERNSTQNFYELTTIDSNNLSDYPIFYTDMIEKAKRKEYIKY